MGGVAIMEVWIRLRRQEDDEDDPELMQLTEESCVRDLASGYWARARIVSVQSC